MLLNVTRESGTSFSNQSQGIVIQKPKQMQRSFDPRLKIALYK